LRFAVRALRWFHRPIIARKSPRKAVILQYPDLESLHKRRFWPRQAVFQYRLLSADLLDHLPREEERGIEELKRYVGIYRSAFLDIQDTVEEIVAEGDKVVVRWRSRGTHQGEFMGVPPTGRDVTFTGMRLFRIAES
jgi:hypothetical protein